MEFTKTMAMKLVSVTAAALMILAAGPANAVPMVYTDRISWAAAVAVVDAAADIRKEDFNASAVTGGTGLGAGPHSFGGTDISMTLNGIGNGGSQSGIINPGEFDGSNALEFQVSHDTSDFLLGGFFLVQGEGITSADFAFTPTVFAFAAQHFSTSTNDGVRITVNSSVFALNDSLPNTSTNDGDGFLGIVDSAGITAFSYDPDNLSTADQFERFHIDELEYAVRSTQQPPPTPAPEPGTLVLLVLGAAGLRFAKRGSSRD